MKFFLVGATALSALSAVTAAAVAPNVKVPDACLPGTVTLVNSTTVNGVPYTVHQCNAKLDDDPASTRKARDDPASTRKARDDPSLHKLDDDPASTRKARSDETSLTKRNMDVCGAPCTTYCSKGVGGPNPNDCATLASQWQNGGEFHLPSGVVWFWTYGSCQAYMGNSLQGQDMVYCYDTKNWAGIVKYLAFNCQGTTGDNGGTCRFYNDASIATLGVQTS